MLCEGVGWKAPKPRMIDLTPDEVRQFRAWAEMTATKNGWNIDNAFLGWLGEAGYAKLIHQELGIERLCTAGMEYESGDGGIDMQVCGEKYQIKTHGVGGQCRVYRTVRINGIVRSRAVNVDAFLFAEGTKLRSFTNEQGYRISLLGWINQVDFLKLGTSHNDTYGKYTIIDLKYLEPVERLVKRLEAFRQLEEKRHGAYTVSR